MKSTIPVNVRPFIRELLRVPFRRLLSTHPEPATVLGGRALVGKSSDSLYYARGAPLTELTGLMTTRGQFWLAAQRDAEAKALTPQAYIENAVAAGQHFFDMDDVHNRDDLKRALRKVVGVKGQFGLLLGGKSVGKSCLLRDLEKNPPNGAVIVSINGRALPADAIQAGIIDSIPESYYPSLTKKWKTWFNSGGQFLTDLAAVSATTVSGTPVPAPTVPQFNMKSAPWATTLAAFAKESKGKGCIIFDEANLALVPDDKHQTRNILNMLTMLTKEEQKLSVLLVSSEFAYPFRLKHIAFNMANFTQTIYAGEIPPGCMLELLTKKWGMGEHLATQLMDHYGGHVWSCYNAILRLADGRENFRPIQGVPNDLAAGIARSMRENKDTVRVMEQLATRGFAPLEEPDDPCAEILARNNVAGVVSAAGTTVGLPLDVWANYKYGLVPTTNAARLLMADEVAPRLAAEETKRLAAEEAKKWFWQK